MHHHKLIIENFYPIIGLNSLDKAVIFFLLYVDKATEFFPPTKHFFILDVYRFSIILIFE